MPFCRPEVSFRGATPQEKSPAVRRRTACRTTCISDRVRADPAHTRRCRHTRRGCLFQQMYPLQPRLQGEVHYVRIVFACDSAAMSPEWPSQKIEQAMVGPFRRGICLYPFLRRWRSSAAYDTAARRNILLGQRPCLTHIVRKRKFIEPQEQLNTFPMTD